MTLNAIRHDVEPSLERRRAVRRSLGLRGVVILYVGRLQSDHGLPYLIDAITMSGTAQGRSLSLLIVGPGREEMTLRRQAAQADGRIVFAAPREKSGLAELYAAAKVFVLPTGTPYGPVVEEAMAAGLPIIASTSTGEAALRRRGRQAGIVPPESTRALASAISQLADDPNGREQLAVSARQASEAVSHDTWTDNFIAATVKTLQAS